MKKVKYVISAFIFLLAMQVMSSGITTTTTMSPGVEQSVSQKPTTGEYNFLPISVGLLLLYFLSAYLTRKGILFSPLTHRRIWNVLLLINFLAAGITGILLVLRLDLRWEIPFIRDVTFWHVETGIAMTIIAFFHCAWHWKYFLSIWDGKRKSR